MSLNINRLTWVTKVEYIPFLVLIIFMLLYERSRQVAWLMNIVLAKAIYWYLGFPPALTRWSFELILLNIFLWILLIWLMALCRPPCLDMVELILWYLYPDFYKLILFSSMAVIIRDFIISKIFHIDLDFKKTRIRRRLFACIDFINALSIFLRFYLADWSRINVQ